MISSHATNQIALPNQMPFAVLKATMWYLIFSRKDVCKGVMLSPKFSLTSTPVAVITMAK